MEKIVIFDFNRTIYDPERKKIMPKVDLVLRTLKKRRFNLYLVATAKPSRAALLKKMDLRKYFKKVFLTSSKENALRKILNRSNANLKKSFVVGDRVRSEIRYGNSLGAQTVWLRSGKFAREKPRLKIEKPTYQISSLYKILSIVK